MKLLDERTLLICFWPYIHSLLCSSLSGGGATVCRACVEGMTTYQTQLAGPMRNSSSQGQVGHTTPHHIYIFTLYIAFVRKLKIAPTKTNARWISWYKFFALYRTRGYHNAIKDSDNDVVPQATADKPIEVFKRTSKTDFDGSRRSQIVRTKSHRQGRPLGWYPWEACWYEMQRKYDRA